QVGDPFDVAQDAAALADHVGEGREAVVQQDDLGDGPGGAAARAHGDAEVGVLEGEDVVDAVSGHGDGVAARLEGLDHVAFLLGGAPSEHRVAVDGLLDVAGCEVAGVVGLVGAGDAEGPGDRPDAGRVVAGDDLDGDALLPEVGDRGGRLGPYPL